MGAQRFTLYGDVAADPSPEEKACKGAETSLILMRLSFTSTNASEDTSGQCDASLAALGVGLDHQAGGRRLQSSKKRSKRSGTEENSAVRGFLASMLLNSTMTYLSVLAACMLCHFLIIKAYRCHLINRKFYKVIAQEIRTGTFCDDLPLFRPLPSALVYPRFELMLHTVFATGLIQVSTDVLGTSAAEYELSWDLLSAAIAIIVLVFLGLILQATRVRRFYRMHAKDVWKPSDVDIQSYANMDDPLLRVIWRCSSYLPRCMRLKPKPRIKGAWELPEAFMEEPGRTERALARAEWFGFKRWCYAPSYSSATPNHILARARHFKALTRAKRYCPNPCDFESSSATNGERRSGIRMVTTKDAGEKTSVPNEKSAMARAAAEYEEVCTSIHRTYSSFPPCASSEGSINQHTFHYLCFFVAALSVAGARLRQFDAWFLLDSRAHNPAGDFDDVHFDVLCAENRVRVGQASIFDLDVDCAASYGLVVITC